jgi:TrmH family RNA methyltransferase
MLHQIRIVLVRPEHGGNVGAVARILKNMGLAELVIVAPRFEREEEAVFWASGAEDLLAAARRVDSLQEALADCRWIVAGTRRAGKRRRSDHTPRTLAARVAAQPERRPLALLFGPEKAGLTASDLALSQELLRIPTSAEHGSLNLAQAVAIVAWELFMAATPAEAVVSKSSEATGAEMEGLFGHLRELLFEVGFVREETAEHQMLAFRRLLARARLRSDEVTLLRGLWRRALWAARRGPARDGSV